MKNGLEKLLLYKQNKHIFTQICWLIRFHYFAPLVIGENNLSNFLYFSRVGQLTLIYYSFIYQLLDVCTYSRGKKVCII